MSRNKMWFLTSVLLVVAMLLAACAPAAAPTPIVQTVVVEGEAKEVVVVATPEPAAAPAAEKKELRMAWGPGDVPTLDTAMAVDVISIQLIDSMTVGLTRQNEQTAELENAMATEVKASEDGLTFTFTLKEGVPWVKYDAVKDEVVKVADCEGKDRMVTAKDFEYGILRTLAPATGSEYAYVMLGIDGASAYNGGEVEDPTTVGVKAIDDKTLEIKFSEPAVYNLNIAGLWVAHAQPSWLIDGDDCTEGRGDKWVETGFYQGYGPFTLKEWVHDAELTLVKNPFWPGDEVTPTAKIDEIHYSLISTEASLAEFEAGNLDVSGVPAGDLDRILTDPVYKDLVIDVFTIGTESYGFNTQLAPTDDVRVRQALSLSIDREALLANVTKTGQAAKWFTHPGVAAGPKPEKYADLGAKYDPEKAKALLQEYLDEKGKKAEDLTIVVIFNTSEAHKKRAEAVQAMWQDNLGIKVELTNQETKVYFKQRAEGKENVYRLSWIQDYPDANNFLREVYSDNNGSAGGHQNVVDWPVADMKSYKEGDNPNYDAFKKLLLDAAKETDPEKRMDMYAQAEKIFIEEQAVVSPLHWYAQKVLVAARVVDTPSITGYDRFEKWDITE